jgi:hypothetical protein
MLGKISLFIPRMARKWLKKPMHWGLDLCRVLGKRRLRFGPPIGTYRILKNNLSIIVPAQFCPPAPADSLRAKSKLGQDGYQPWPIFHVRIRQARLVGKSLAVMNDRKELLWDSVFRPADGDRSDPSFHHGFLPPPLTLTGSWTSLISRWTIYGNYYEWLMGGLPRLACLKYFPADTQILVPAKLHRFQRESLEMLGLLDRCRSTAETHLLVEDYYHASQTSMIACHNPYAVKFLRNSFLPVNPPVTAGKKLYISRQKAISRAPLNEPELEDFLSANGWEIIHAEDYSFAGQIQLFSQATAICLQHGAGLANMVWSQPPCKILELCPENFLNGSGEALALSCGHEYRHLVFPADRQWRIKIDVNLVKQALHQLNCR